MNSIVFSTKRLFLRPFNPELDATCMYRLNQNPKVLRYTGDVPFESISEAKTFLQNYEEYTKHGVGRWAVIRKEDHQWLGWCGLKYHHHENFVDLGYRFFEEFWNKGYATESSIGALEYGFNTLGIHEIVTRANEKNAASIRVIEKLSFTECFDVFKDAFTDRTFRLQKNDFKLNVR